MSDNKLKVEYGACLSVILVLSSKRIRTFNLRRGIHLLVLLLLTGSLSCMGKSVVQVPDQTQTRNSFPADLKQDWELQTSRLSKNSKDYPRERLELTITLLDKATDQQAQEVFNSLRANPKADSELSEYERTLSEAFVARDVRQKNQARLTELLSARFPEYIASTPTEFYLATSELIDPLLVLFTSYEKSQDDKTRAALVHALSHTTSLTRNNFPDEKAYVAALKDWYLKNKNVVKPNSYYDPNSRFAENQKLFIVSQ